MSNATRACIALLLLAAAPAFAQQAPAVAQQAPAVAQQAPAAGATPPAPGARASLSPQQRKGLSRFAGPGGNPPPPRPQGPPHAPPPRLRPVAAHRDKGRRG